MNERAASSAKMFANSSIEFGAHLLWLQQQKQHQQQLQRADGRTDGRRRANPLAAGWRAWPNESSVRSVQFGANSILVANKSPVAANSSRPDRLALFVCQLWKVGNLFE